MKKTLLILALISSLFAYGEDRGVWIWNLYSKGAIIGTVPADSIDSVAIVAKKQIKFIDDKRNVLAAKLTSQIDSIVLSQYINNDSLAIVDAKWNWKDLGKGATSGHAMVTVFGLSQSISIVKYPAASYSTSIIDAQSPNQATTPTLGTRNNAKAAINGSYFDMTALTPSTFIAINGTIRGWTTQTATNDIRVTGIVGLKDEEGHQIEIAPYNNSNILTYARQYYSVLASGPLLMRKKVFPEFADASFNNDRHPRTAIGYDDHGYIYYMVVDGRNVANGANGVSIPELARIARYAGMTYALNLDGGGSSCIWTSTGGTLNYPCDNGKWDHNGARVVPNIIMMK